MSEDEERYSSGAGVSVRAQCWDKVNDATGLLRPPQADEESTHKQKKTSYARLCAGKHCALLYQLTHGELGC